MRQIIHIYTLAPATSPRRRPAFPAGTCFPHQPLFSEDSVAGQLLLKATIWQGNWGSHCWARNCPIRCGGRDTRFNIRTRSALASRRGLAVASALSVQAGTVLNVKGGKVSLGPSLCLLNTHQGLTWKHLPGPSRPDQGWCRVLALSQVTLGLVWFQNSSLKRSLIWYLIFFFYYYYFLQLKALKHLAEMSTLQVSPIFLQP